MSVAVAVRRAHPQDLPAIARTLARAFLDDPVAEWAYRADRHRLAALERFQAIRARQLLASGDDVWTTDDQSSAALWAAPERWRASVRETLEVTRTFMHPALIGRLPLVAAGWLNLERKHPAKPAHYYLAVLGTDPDHQGQGLGSALLQPVLERCDEDGVGAFLESSKESNVAFYARHGFRVTQQVRLPRGPCMWKMWREPRR
jgi:ribosomal protein S18 acetylase RimI-like enzyme